MSGGAGKKVIYDANLIIYYCFMHEEKIKGNTVTIRVMESTNKIQSLTERFLKSGIEIETISGVIQEIYSKGIARIVDEFCDDPRTKDLMLLPRRARITNRIRLRLARKTEEKIQRLQKKAWFNVIEYRADEKEMERVKNFYWSLSGTAKMAEHMRRKRVREPWPSDVDMALLVYSQETGAPIVTNDSDLTCFKNELESARLCAGILIFP
ncbi:MAG: hypothetical protein WAV32_08870 [Halobacteriota archaeon]